MLHSGNNDKRFILARFKDGKFLNTSFRYLSLDKQNKLRNYMCNLLRKEIVLLRKSLLLERQRKSILSGENIWWINFFPFESLIKWKAVRLPSIYHQIMHHYFVLQFAAKMHWWISNCRVWFILYTMVYKGLINNENHIK